NLNGIDQLSTVPTAQVLAGNFNNLSKPTTIYDPLNPGVQFAGNIIPASRISPAAQSLLQYFPAPTYDNLLVQNFRLVANTPNNSQSIGVRVTAPLTNKDRLSFNEQYQNRNSYSLSNFGEFRNTTTGSGVSASVSWSHSFKARVNNNASISYSRNTSNNQPYFANNGSFRSLGLAGNTTDPESWGPPSLGFTNYGGTGDSDASISRPQTVAFTDTFTYIIGRKTNLTFGFNLQKQQFNTLSYSNTRGDLSFNGQLTSQ